MFTLKENDFVRHSELTLEQYKVFCKEAQKQGWGSYYYLSLEDKHKIGVGTKLFISEINNTKYFGTSECIGGNDVTQKFINYLGGNNVEKFEVGKKYKMLTGTHTEIKKGEVFTVERIDYDGDAYTSTCVCVLKSRLWRGDVVAVADNEMPELEAGKHVVRTKYGYGVVVHDEDFGVKWLYIGDGYKDYDWDHNKGSVKEVHSIPKYGGGLDPDEYNESTLLWKRDDKKDKLRVEHEQLQKQIAELQSKANDIGKLI